MNKIKIQLDKEESKLMASNNFMTLPESVQEILIDIKIFIQDLLDKKINLDELKTSFLTATLVYLGKLEKLHKAVIENWIEQITLKLDFNAIDYSEFMEYFSFRETDEIKIESQQTTSLFIRTMQSSLINWIYLLHQEFYEHEDDTDDSRYYVVLKWF